MEERAWYIIQTYSGLENAAKTNIERRVKSMNMEEYIFQVLVPEEKKIEKKKNGELKEVVTKIYPGYVFIDMIVTDDTWFMVRNTPMVTGFLGSSGGGSKPVPLLDEEIIPILKMCGLTEDVKFEAKVGDKVKIISGAFANQYGTVDAIDLEKRQVTVLIDFFGRPTPADLDFAEVKKD
jgi:transcriptional antiterminator NusG